ncbi:MAG: c-type cytochrome, partial [Dehalococcoidia bacterium]
MVILVFLLLVGLGGYTLLDPQRQENARAQQTDVLAERGATLFASNCRPCHGNVGEGRVGPPLNRADLRDPLKLAQNQAFVHDTVECGRVGTLMPTWGQINGGPLNEEQIRDLVTLITVNPSDAWNKWVKPDSEAANKISTPLPIQDLTSGALTGSTQSICGQKIAGTALALAAQTPGTPSTALAETATDNMFADAAFTVPSGQAITLSFNNKGSAIHNWHVLEQKDDSGKDVTTGANGTAGGTTSSVSFTISKPGQYRFQCDFHPTEMVGSLFVVAPGSAPLPAAPSAVPSGVAAPNPRTGIGIATT